MNLIEKELTHKIIGAAIEVSNELGCGFLEGVYEKALAIAMREKELKVAEQVPLFVRFRGLVVGEFFADTLVEDRVIVELKVVHALAPEREAQLLNYLKATDVKVGLLINFGRPKLEWSRFVH